MANRQSEICTIFQAYEYVRMSNDNPYLCAIVCVCVCIAGMHLAILCNENAYPSEYCFNICFRIKNHEMISNWPAEVQLNGCSIAITTPPPFSSTLMFCQTWGQYWLHSKYYFVHGYLISFIEYTIIQFIVVLVVAVATCFKWKHFSHNCWAPHHSPRLSGHIFAVMYIYQLLYEVCKRIQLKL